MIKVIFRPSFSDTFRITRIDLEFISNHSCIRVHSGISMQTMFSIHQYIHNPQLVLVNVPLQISSLYPVPQNLIWNDIELCILKVTLGHWWPFRFVLFCKMKTLPKMNKNQVKFQIKRFLLFKICRKILS